MNHRDFVRIVDRAFAPFLRALGFEAQPPSINGKAYDATFISARHAVSITFEPGDQFQATYVFTRTDGELSDIDDRDQTPRLQDLNRRYMELITEEERSANEALISDLYPQDKSEKALIKAAKELRLVLPLYLRDRAEEKMALTTRALVKYLGRPAAVLLSDAPFNDWDFEKSFEYDLEETRIDYVFPDNGMDFVCDQNDNVDTIFLYSDDQRRFEEGLLDVPFSLTRQQVVERLGPPEKSGGRISDPVLGESGVWDRFARPGYSIHIRYRVDADRIDRITLMRADVVP